MQLADLESDIENADIEPELVRMVYSALVPSLLAILVNSVILGAIQWELVPHATILTWLVVANGLSLARLVLYHKFKSLPVTEQADRFWKQTVVVTGFASGAVWGSAAIWLFPVGEITHQVFLAFVLAGMSAGAVTTLTPMIATLTGFILLSMLPLICRFLLIDTQVAYAMGFMTTLFTLMILVTAKRSNASIRELVQMRYKQQMAKRIIQQQALYDPLTNLPNRRMLTTRLKQEIARSYRHKHISAVLFLDLDYFKNTNDSLGHTVGDGLLKQVAQRMQLRLRDEDFVARLGGDEFVIVLSELGDDLVEATDNAETFAYELLDQFTAPFDVQGNKLHISASVGIVLFPLVKATPEELLQKSDVAMYEAKEAGRNRVRLFMPEMQQAVYYQRDIEKGLRQALAENTLALHYQPMFDADGNIFAVEALLRWKQPGKGYLPPDEFIGIAERSGLIISLGDWVIRTACEDLAKLAAFGNITMCINVSPKQFENSEFVNSLKRVFEETGVNPENIRIEITENVVMRNVEKAIEKMKSLAAIGVHFSIDDFGTGYSSLSYLKRLPVDLLKIDKSFMQDIDSDPNDVVIVETIIAMAKHMLIDVVAEGVETEKTLAFLKSKGCSKFQGHLFSVPVPLADLLNEGKTRRAACSS